MKVLIIRAVAAISACLLVGCATGPSGSTKAVSLFADAEKTTIDPGIQRMLDDAGQAVAERLNVDLSHVENLVVDKDEMARWHHQSVKRGYLSRFDQKHRERLVDNIVASRLDDLLAFYDDTEKVIIYDAENVASYVQTLSRFGVSTEDALMPLFLHESVHAADDVLVDFRALDQTYGGNNLAYSAVFEGHAELIARELCADFGCVRGFDVASSSFRHRNGGVATLDVLPGRSGDSATLRYLEGRKYLERLAVRANGEALVMAALHQPPRDAVSIFAPDSRLDMRREAENRALQAALESFDLPLKTGDWVQIAGDPTDANQFPANQERREQLVSTRLRVVRGAAETVFYEQSGDYLRPLEVRVTRTVAPAAAKQFAADAARKFRRQSGSLVGAGVSMRDLSAHTESLEAASDDVDGVAYAVSAQLYSQGERVGLLSFSASASDQYVVEVVSGLPFGQHAASVRAGRRFLAGIASGEIAVN